MLGLWLMFLLQCAVFAAPPDLLVVSQESSLHTGLLAIPGHHGHLMDPIQLSGVPDYILKMLGIMHDGKSMADNHFPSVLFVVVIGGLAPEFVSEIPLPELKHVIRQAMTSPIIKLPNPRSFYSILRSIFTSQDMLLTEYIKSNFKDGAPCSTFTTSKSACSSIGCCSDAPIVLHNLVHIMNGSVNTDNTILSWTASGQQRDLDLSDDVINAFVQEMASLISVDASKIPVSEEAPTFVSLVVSSLDSVMNKFGAKSSEAESCLLVLNACIPHILTVIVDSYGKRAETLLVFLPPSDAAYISQQVHNIVEVSTGASSKDLPSVYLPDHFTYIDVDESHSKLSDALPPGFQVLNIRTNSTATRNPPNPALYQILLWVSVLLFVLILASVCLMCCAETRKDTILYSKFTPSFDKKVR